MGIFSLTKEISVDLGTANTLIIHNDKIIIDEPSIVAIDVRTGKMIAVGKEAQRMGSRTRRHTMRASSAQRRYCRLQRRRDDDSRTYRQSLQQKQVVQSINAYGCRNSFRFYRSGNSCCP